MNKPVQGLRNYENFLKEPLFRLQVPHSAPSFCLLHYFCVLKKCAIQTTICGNQKEKKHPPSHLPHSVYDCCGSGCPVGSGYAFAQHPRHPDLRYRPRRQQPAKETQHRNPCGRGEDKTACDDSSGQHLRGRPATGYAAFCGAYRRKRQPAETYQPAGYSAAPGDRTPDNAHKKRYTRSAV